MSQLTNELADIGYLEKKSFFFLNFLSFMLWFQSKAKHKTKGTDMRLDWDDMMILHRDEMYDRTPDGRDNDHPPNGRDMGSPNAVIQL